MKYIFILSFIFLSKLFYAQTITNTSSAIIPCCSFSDSIDYNSDGVFDIKIYSRFGVDNFAYFTNSLQNIEIATPVDSGQTFGFYNSSMFDVMFTGTTILCDGWFLWVPGTTAPKYLGFRDVSILNDTTYGWVKLDFVGQQNTCTDTVFVLETTYNSIANTPLFAGEKILPNSIKEKNEILDFINIFPNPSQNSIQIRNNLNTPLELQIRNIAGKTITGKIVLSQNQTKQINTSKFAKGIYIIESKNEHSSSFQKLIIN